jgi:hypothetical protein
MLWLLISGFFCWLIFREIYYSFQAPAGFDKPHSAISKPYLAALILLAMAFAYPPINTWQFERFLSKKAQILSENSKANVHCNSVGDTFFDPNVFAAGHAQFDTGEIVFARTWCESLQKHLKKPQKLTREGIVSVHIFAHESMHIRGEHDEAKTECQAIQRYARAAILLGVPADIAKQNGLIYYQTEYQQRATQGQMSSQYYSAECAPNKALDEKLADSIWR